MKTHITYTLFILLLSTSVFSQTIKGRVTDGFTQKPIAGAIVTPENGSPAISDTTGAFEMPCTATPLHLTVHFMGYQDLHINVTNCSRSLKVEMVPSSVQLNEVQINSWGTQKNNNQLDQPKSVGVLTADDLNRESGLSLQDALNLLPGVDMESRTPWGGQRIIIRGYYGGGTNGSATPSINFNGAGYQVYLNNIPITDATGTTIMDDIDFSTLGKVEVIKGPQSALFGQGIGGIVHLYTEQPEPNATVISQEAMGGSYGLLRTNTTVTTAGSNFDMVLNYGHQSYNGFRDHDSSSKDYITFNGTYFANEKHSISAYFAYSRSLEELAGEMDSAELYGKSDTGVSSAEYIAHNSHVAIESFRGGITDKYQFNPHFSEESTIFLTAHTLDQPFAHGFDDYSALDFGGRTGFVYESNKKKKVSVHGILGASVLKTSEYENGLFIVPIPIPNPPQIPTTQEDAATNASVFTEWRINLPLQFSITAGASLNFNNFGLQNLLNSGTIWDSSKILTQKFPVAFTPDVALEKLFGNNVSLYADVSWGFTPPNFSNITNSLGQIDSNLKPERAIQYEVGTKGSFINKKLSYQLALFDLDVYNKLETATGNLDGASYTYTTNIGQQRNLGVEFSLSYAIIADKNKPVSLLRPFITYTFSDFRYINFKSADNNDSTTVNYSGNKVAGVEPDKLVVGLDFETKVGIYLHLTNQYNSKMPYTFDDLHYVKAYDLLGGKIGYHKEFIHHIDLDLYFGVDNMLSSIYPSFVFIGENLNQISGDGYFLPAPYKPTVYGGATISYKF